MIAGTLASSSSHCVSMPRLGLGRFPGHRPDGVEIGHPPFSGPAEKTAHEVQAVALRLPSKDSLGQGRLLLRQHLQPAHHDMHGDLFQAETAKDRQ
jgi:hypothetical protein